LRFIFMQRSRMRSQESSFGKAQRQVEILPVSECTLILLMASLSRFAIREFGTAGFRGCCLASSPTARFPGFPGKSAGGPILGFRQGG